jgi:hypothetical protein
MCMRLDIQMDKGLLAKKDLSINNDHIKGFFINFVPYIIPSKLKFCFYYHYCLIVLHV